MQNKQLLLSCCGKNHLFPLNLKRFGYYTCWKQLTVHIEMIDYSRNCVATSN